MSALREQFERETGFTWENSQGEPDIDYVHWLESRPPVDSVGVDRADFATVAEYIDNTMGVSQKVRNALANIDTALTAPADGCEGCTNEHKEWFARIGQCGPCVRSPVNDKDNYTPTTGGDT